MAQVSESGSGGADARSIVFIGDSLTRATFRNKGATSYVGFARRLESERSDVVVDGLDGITSSAWVELYPGRGLTPDLAFVMLGTNDAAQNVKADELVSNLKKLKEMIGCRVVFLIPPLTLHEDSNMLIKEYAVAIKKTFPDGFADLTTLDIPRDGYFPDGVHLLTKGHDLIYDVVKPTIEKQLDTRPR